MPSKETVFCDAWRAAVAATRERKDMTTEAIADALDITKGAINGPFTAPRSMSFDLLRRFIDFADMDQKEARELQWAWFDERALSGAIGAAVQVFVSTCRVKCPVAEFDRLRDLAFEAIIENSASSSGPVLARTSRKKGSR